MPETSITEITVEKTPAYFVSKTAPGRVHSLNSTIKLIVVVRNPITRAISDYTQTISKKRRDILMPSFEEMVLGNNSSNATVVRQSNFATDPLKGFPCVLRKDDTLHCLGKTKGRAHPNIRLDVIQKLANFYRPQNEEFFKLINKRFHWHI
uniref:BMA-HST-3.2 n=1 Tax=Brugia malayi TaxID=6279 RepID=A0A1I9G721_BRUMA|nr:BMA-HST-3.2 [Brugia malayi]